MTEDEPWVVHVAGPVTGPVQSCASCGHVLQDNTGWFEGRVGVWPPDPDAGPTWWPEGKRIAVLGVCSATLPDDRVLESDERLCAGAN